MWLSAVLYCTAERFHAALAAQRFDSPLQFAARFRLFAAFCRSDSWFNAAISAESLTPHGKMQQKDFPPCCIFQRPKLVFINILWRAEILGFGFTVKQVIQPNPIKSYIYKQHFTRISARLFTTVKSCWNPWTAMVFTSNLLALIRMRTIRNLCQILGFHTHTHQIVYEYGSNPAENLGFQNPRLSAGFKNCLWIPTLISLYLLYTKRGVFQK